MTVELLKISEQDPNRCVCGGSIMSKNSLDWLGRRQVEYTCGTCGNSDAICIERCPNCH